MNAIDCILDVQSRNADREFICDTISGRSLTFGELHQSALNIAQDFRKRGLKKGDRLVLLLNNSLEFAKLYFGCLYLGVVTVPVNPAHTQSELDYVLRHSGAKSLLTSTDVLARHSPHAFAAAGKMVLVLNGDESVPKDFERLDLDRLPKAETIRPFEGVESDSWMTVVYTSGTAAKPKGVVHTIADLIDNARLFNETMGIGPDNRFYGILSMTYVGGYFNLLMLPFTAGASVVLANTFDARASLHFWSAAIRNNVNTLWFVPTILSVLMEVDRGREGENYCRSSVKLALVGTAPLTLELKNAFEARYGLTLHQNYALTETLFLTTNVPARPTPGRSVGRALPGVQVKIAGDGPEGEIIVKTPFLMRGYLNAEKETPSLKLEDGYLATGDLGVLDEAGELFISGRRKDLIIRGGVNISPAAVESVLMKHTDVLESAVVGIPQALYGEDVAAVVRLKTGSDSTRVLAELAENCREELSPMSRPAQIFEMSELPKTTNGKVQKGKIRDLLIHKLGLSQFTLFESPNVAPLGFSQDVIMLSSKGGVLCCNVRAKTFVQVSLGLFSRLNGVGQAGELWVRDCGTFSNAEGLLEDPTRMRRDLDAIEPKNFVTLESARQFLASKFILSADDSAYEAHFAHKSGPLDQKHFGTFHQQLGVEILLKRRLDPNQWWYSQKFDPGTSRIREGLYKYVQQHFVAEYFASKDFTGKRVLDFGCGSGYGSRQFVERGASVVGLEPDEALLSRARADLGSKFDGHRLDLSSKKPLGDLESGSFDFVWISDVFLFYFYPINPSALPAVSAVELLSEIYRVIKPGGTCTIMQSHGVFWLVPWLGAETRPFTVLTEYADKLYSVAPGLEEMTSVIAKAGFLIRNIWEPKPDKAAEKALPRHYHFARQFPQWWVFELVK